MSILVNKHTKVRVHGIIGDTDAVYTLAAR